MYDLIRGRKKIEEKKRIWNSHYFFCGLFVIVDQLTLVRLKQAAALFNSFSATCSTDCVVSFNDSSELHQNSAVRK